VLDADRPTEGALLTPIDGLARIVVQRGRARSVRRDGDELVLELPDRRISKPHLAIERAGDGFVVRDLGSSNGTFLGAFEGGERVAGRATVGERFICAGHTVLAILPDGGPSLARMEAERPWPFLTFSPDFARALGRLERVAASSLPLLLLGETGTGKEVLARAVHDRSGRPGPFVAVNCAALPAGLVEAHLFGHTAGAFSGARRDEAGYVRAADRGTLFLDEIGDLGDAAQATLLRVIQEGEVVPVGAFRPTPVSVRFVAATHAPLPELVARGEFREDLYARLQGFVFQVPPLRERRADIGVLLAALWPKASPELTLHVGAVDALLRHEYPMNVRELKLALEAAAVLSDGSIEVGDLPKGFGVMSDTDSLPDDERLRTELTARLQANGHNISQVARDMGKARQQVQRWVKRLGLGKG